MINEIQVGEIIRIDGREYLIILTTGKNGRMEWEQPTLKILDNHLKENFSKKGRKLSYYRKKFKGIKLTNLKKQNAKKQ